MNLKYLYLPLATLFTLASLNATIVYYDFDDDTVNGAPADWSRNTTLIFVTDDYSESPSNSLFMRDGSNRTVSLTDYVTIPDVTKDLVFSFDYFAGVTAIEPADSLVFHIDFGQGGGFQPVLKDAGLASGFAQTSEYTGTLITLDDSGGTPIAGDFKSYSLIVPSSYYSDGLSSTSFKLRYVWNGSSNDEDAYIDNVGVAAVVPEPSQYAILLALGVLFVAYKRRRS